MAMLLSLLPKCFLTELERKPQSHKVCQSTTDILIQKVIDRLITDIHIWLVW